MRPPLTRLIDGGSGETLRMTIAWGDGSTAIHRTGSPTIAVVVTATPATCVPSGLATVHVGRRTGTFADRVRVGDYPVSIAGIPRSGRTFAPGALLV